MGLITWIKAVWNKVFRSEIVKRFETEVQLSSEMEGWIDIFYRITSGHPIWESKEDDIESINFAGFVDDVTAGLVTLDLGVQLPETPRGQYLQKQADYVLQVITDKVSEGLGNCGIMFKPNGTTIDYVEPGNFAPTDSDSNGNVLGCVFQSRISRGQWIYTRLEWHRFEETAGQRLYRITNYAYKAKKAPGTDNTREKLGDPCPLTEVTEWAGIAPDIYLENIERPLFAYFKNPAPNRFDRSSPLSVPLWHNAIKELRDLDIAWSRKGTEMEDSKHVLFMPFSAIRYAETTESRTKDKSKDDKISLPRFVKGVEVGVGVNSDNMIHEHVATLLTDQRIKDINSILAMISTKCGFSQGMFVLDEKTGMVTATQVEADDQETIRTVKNLRDALENTIKDLLYALNVFADLYTDTPAEAWDRLMEQTTFNFGDITYSYNEDRANWWNYVVQKYMPAWLYFKKFEGMEEEEAKAYVEQAQPKEKGLFEEE